MSITYNPSITRIPALGGPATLGVQADALEVELTTTAQTTILTYTAQESGLLWIGGYVRVVTASTVVTVEVTYTDAGGAQTTVVLNAIDEAVGSYSLPVFVIAVVPGAVTVNVTAGTANQVFASASIVKG